MAKKLVCTICSREKRTDEELLPAKNRYISERIDRVGKFATENGLPLVILSGEYGLLCPDDKIPYYDHLLKDEEVESLAEVVKQQIADLGATELIFYAKPREKNWEPYYLVLEIATEELCTKLTVIPVS